MAFAPTDEQKRLLAHPPGTPARVFAGPGTGKSATLVAYVESLLDRENPPKLKLLTFTRAATGELAKKVSEHPAAAAERPSTIHSFAISILLRNPDLGSFPKPLRIADDWEEDEIVYPTLSKRINVPQKTLEKLFFELASNWESLEAREHPKVGAEHRARFMGGWQEHREVFGYTLLAELPYALLKALKEHPDLDGLDYELLIVDEYQDLNACDLEVLRLIAQRGCSVIGAGDDDQSIYSFRRAAPAGIRRFLADYPSARDYVLSITHRCGSHIIAWARYVIEGDPGRPSDKPPLSCAPGSQPGEVALLSFKSAEAEAKGIAKLVQALTSDKQGIPPAEVLVLLRGDYRGSFSKPIKKALNELGISCSDGDAAKRMLAEPGNRRMLAMFRLLVNRNDSLAWATLLKLTPGIGDSFVEMIYERAVAERSQFAHALLAAFDQGFANGPKASSNRATRLISDVTTWLDSHTPAPDLHGPWGAWIIATAGSEIAPAPSAELQAILLAIDDLIEAEQGLGRYLNQLMPLAKDLTQSSSPGVRIMTMASSKGLTVRATIVAALEDAIVPRPDQDAAEERRLLYVAMTRSKEFLFGTWAGKRKGPTARSGKPSLGRRLYSRFLEGGPVESQDGLAYLKKRW